MVSFLFKQLEPLSILKKIAKLFATLLLAGFAFGVYCFLTPNGTKVALQLIADLTPYQIQF
ncbi:MAG TPA: hypothetical protein PLD88_06570, partial [Candidatus Berkiella sp.]|nr:hypothetical protein [Candidatus Berkiella sp.]